MNAIRTITAAVAEIRGVALADILSDRRSKEIVRPRHEAMYFAKTMTPATLPAIGRRMGGRDHSTVLSGIRNIEARIATEAGYGDEIEAIGAIIAKRLPGEGKFQLVPAEDIDVETLARRIEAAVAAGETISVFADEVAALASRFVELDRKVIELGSKIAAMARREAEFAERLAAHEARTLASTVTIAAPHPAPVQAVIDAFRQFESDRFSARERFAQQQLDRALKALQTTVEQKDIAA
ncbi:helix-turn-helix domain-containing protein [Jiella pacifica]|nr:helix-turn-helix domain-containing protein [Jiella pacifica]